MAQNLEKLKLRYTMNRVGSMMSFFFTEQNVRDYASATTSDTALFTRYFNEMLGNGIYLAPSQFETSFLSTAHSQADVEKTVEAHYNSLKKIKDS
jgi:glutamate-1-semialdehyde 2,1-aminomutase